MKPREKETVIVEHRMKALPLVVWLSTLCACGFWRECNGKGKGKTTLIDSNSEEKILIDISLLDFVLC